ncbi:hypothetical protein D3C73_609150 [compost metagenome]
MQATGDIDADARFKLLLDQEEEVFDFAGIDQLRRVDLFVYCNKGFSDLRCDCPIKDAGFGKHHQMGAIDATKAVDMMVPGAIEERTQYRFLVDRIGKLAGVGKARVFVRHGFILSGRRASHRGRCSAAGRGRR